MRLEAYSIDIDFGVTPVGMTEIDALFFMVGLVLSLGSIATLIVMNITAGASSDTLLIRHQRLFASASSRALTIPGVCLLLAAAILSSCFSGRPLLGDGWSLAQLVLAALIFINTMVFLRPLLAEVSRLAEQGAAQGQILEGYAGPKKLEDRFGAANLVMIVATLLLVIFRS